MGSMSVMHWVIVIGVVVLLFGRGKISGLMGDVAQGIKSFRTGLQEDEPVEASRKQEVAPADPIVRREIGTTAASHDESTDMLNRSDTAIFQKRVTRGKT